MESRTDIDVDGSEYPLRSSSDGQELVSVERRRDADYEGSDVLLSEGRGDRGCTSKLYES